ncbi:MAG: lysophospholipid acyltransferase family protein [Nitrospirae bacterium]|nr:lysophospholipid acyltransferase family protein [Nitrospirota bacterium]
MSKVQSMKLAVMAYGLSRLIRALAATLRIEMKGGEHLDTLRRQGQRVIFACWHGRLLMLPPAYEEQGGEATILASRHRDGELLSRTVRRFGIQAVRGSTTRGGASGLRQLARAYRSGSDLGIAPDGPRGPREVVQRGIIEVARLTGAPILPVSFGALKKKSSTRGTLLSSPIPFPGSSTSSASLSGWSRMPRLPCLKRNVKS